MVMMIQIPPPYQSEVLIAMFPLHKEPKRSSKCLVYTLAGFVAIFALWLAFASIVLRVQDPKLEMISAKVMHISYSTSPPSSASFNVTMIACVMIKNPNFGRFSYENSTVSVLYGSASVGAGGMGGGRVEARETKEINVMANIRSSKQVCGNLTNDIHSGILKLRSYAKFSGTVRLLKIVKKRKTIVMACIMNLNLKSRSIQHFQC